MKWPAACVNIGAERIANIVTIVVILSLFSMIILYNIQPVCSITSQASYTPFDYGGGGGGGGGGGVVTVVKLQISPSVLPQPLI